MRKRLLTVLTAATLGLALTGCQPAGPGATPAPGTGAEAATTAPGEAAPISYEVTENAPAVSAAQVSDNYGQEPEVTLPEQDQIGETIERRVIHEGTGNEITSESTVLLKMTVYDFGTGQASSPYQAVPQGITLNAQGLPPYLAPMLECVKSGSRIVTIVPGAVMLGSTTGAENVPPSLFVMDVKESTGATPGAAAEGTAKEPTQDMVTVSTESGKQPEITVNGGEVAKDEQVIDTVIEGTGETVADGALVTVQYTGLLLADGQEFDSSWTRGGTPASFSTTGVVPGFANALVGQKVGSRVVTVFGSDLGYGDQGSSSIPAGASLVFVIDIIDTF